MMTLEQINAQKQALAEQMKQLEEMQKNFAKRDEGFKKLEALDVEFAKKRADILKAHYITEDEVLEMQKLKNAPKPLLLIEFTDGDAKKSWDWFIGRKGKVPAQVQAIREKGLEEVSKYLTEEGKKAIATPEGKAALDKWIAQAKAANKE